MIKFVTHQLEVRQMLKKKKIKNRNKISKIIIQSVGM